MAVDAHGFLLMDKPAGISSYGVVHAVRAALGGRRRGPSSLKVGHTGTLDPAATGLLVVLCGAATRLGPFLVGCDKTYRGVVRLGAATDTLDADGALTASAAVDFAAEDCAAAAAGFRGRIEQIPPVISALKVGGVALHRLARRGDAVPEIKPRPVTIHSLETAVPRWAAAPGPDDGFTAADGLIYEIELLLSCSSGTYVRSLARDLALSLGTVGHLCSLRRQRVGIFSVADAVPGDRIRDGRALRAAMRPLADVLADVPSLALTADEAAAVRLGSQPEPSWLERVAAPPADDGTVRLLDPDGGLVAVCSLAGGEQGAGLRLAAVFPRVDPPGTELA